VVDHINHEGLDNRRENLQCVTQRENSQNRRDGGNRGRSKYIGVQWCQYHKKWRVRICINGRKVHISYYDCEIEAAKAYYEAAKEYQGKYARLNFATGKLEESGTKTPQFYVEGLRRRFRSLNLF
jgi:hypothetical protein